MPQIQEINDFKAGFTRLGNEEEIRSQRGEQMPEITPPEAESVDDLNALFDEDTADVDVLDDGALFDEAAEDDNNLSEGLSEGLSDEIDEPDEDDMFGDFDGLDGLEEPELADESEMLDEAAEDDFNLPEGLTEGLSDELDEPGEDDMFGDFDGLDGLEEPESVEEPESLEAVEAVEEPDSVDDADVFDELGDLNGFDEPEALEEADEAEEAEPPEQDDMFGDFDGLDGLEEPESLDESPEDFAEIDEPESDELDVEDFETEELDSGEDEEDDFSLEDFSLGDLDDDVEASEFSLGDLGEEFGVDEAPLDDLGQLEDLKTAASLSEEGLGSDVLDEDYAIPDDDYIELKKTLGQMPRNLKLIIEELIGEKNLSGDNLDKIIDALVAGKTAKEIGAITSKITGKKIKIPVQYEKRSAEEFEKEKSSFSYLFRKNFIPMFRAAALAAGILGLIIFLGYRFVYKPLYAESLYKKGYVEIEAGENVQANEYFARGFSEWPKKNWFYRYAEAFAELKQYSLAEEKYQQLLNWQPEERQAILDFARLEYKVLGKYPEAEKLLGDYLFDNLLDYDVRLMLGDTYMEWARELEPAKYEDARFHYAKLLEQFGGQDEILFRMLRYFIRTDNYAEAMKLYEAFSNNEKADIEPDIYAELAGYLIDKGRMEDVREILMKAKSIEEEIPEIHYQLARYFNIIDIPLEEEKALNAAVWLFENTSPLTRTRKGMLIDSYNRLGMVLYKQDKYLDAEDYYLKAARNYLEAVDARQITPEEKYGKIFSNLGDISYYISGNYEQALEYFKQAEQNKYTTPELKYKKGYIYYSMSDYKNALVEFYDTAGGFSVDPALMYATANTLFNRNDYYLAEGYYTHLMDILGKEYSSLNYVLIEEIPEHRALVENMMKVSNNLGVTKYRLYERSRDPEKNSEAMVLLTDSIEYHDTLARDPESLIEPESVNLAYINSRGVFYPVSDFRLQIYQDIPKDMTMTRY